MNQRDLGALPTTDKLNDVFHKIFSFPGISSLGFVGIFQVPSYKLKNGNWYVKVVSTNLIFNARTFFVGAHPKEEVEENLKKDKYFPWNFLPCFWCFEDHICLSIPNLLRLFSRTDSDVAQNGEEVFQTQISIPLHENSFLILALIYGEIIGFFLLLVFFENETYLVLVFVLQMITSLSLCFQMHYIFGIDWDFSIFVHSLALKLIPFIYQWWGIVHSLDFIFKFNIIQSLIWHTIVGFFLIISLLYVFTFLYIWQFTLIFAILSSFAFRKRKTTTKEETKSKPKTE